MKENMWLLWKRLFGWRVLNIIQHYVDLEHRLPDITLNRYITLRSFQAMVCMGAVRVLFRLCLTSRYSWVEGMVE